MRPHSRFKRVMKDRAFAVVCWGTASICVIILAVLLIAIAYEGIGHLDLSFLTDSPSRHAEEAGMGPAIWGSLWICSVCALVALPIGVATAIYLEEYRPKHRWSRRLLGFVQLNISNLAGVPSIVYGILGMTAFVQMFGLFGTALTPTLRFGVDFYDQFADEAGNYLVVKVSNGETAPPTTLITGMIAWTDIDGKPVELRVVSDSELSALYAELDERLASLPKEERDEAEHERLTGLVIEGTEPQRFEIRHWWYMQVPFGRGVLAGGLTLMLVVLPIVIISSQEALRSVPSSLREAALGLGATRWQVICRAVLPCATPGLMTGSILAMSRAIGEAAPILMIAGIVYVSFAPGHLMDDFTHMPLQIFNWAREPRKEFHELAATGIIVLLVILLLFNAVAIFIRQKFQSRLQ